MNNEIYKTENDFYVVDGEVEDPVITCFVKEHEMLKITKEGFWVRGVKVPQDDKEAESVYKAFKSFLMWAGLNTE
jgi:hypothetical protein